MIWFNGHLSSSAQIDASSAGHLLGWGVFTTLAIRGGAPIFWEKHAARLQRDAQAARVEWPFEAAHLRAGLGELLDALQIGDGLARVTGTARGDGRWNDDAGADWSILAHSAPPHSSAPLRLQVSPFRVSARAPLAGVKATSYLPYLWAWQSARDNGYDEALLLTESGWICESARASIFWAKDGTLWTPSLSCGALRGVGREVVLEGWGARETHSELDALWRADEAFLVSGAAGARAVGSISEGNLARQWAAPGPFTRAVQEAWFKVSE